MEYIAGKDRFQAFTSTLEERIASDNPVRVIDAFVEVLPLEQMDFIFLVYNSRRAVSILSVPELLRLLKSRGGTCLRALKLAA